jgi:hypothetical protein
VARTARGRRDWLQKMYLHCIRRFEAPSSADSKAHRSLANASLDSLNTASSEMLRLTPTWTASPLAILPCTLSAARQGADVGVILVRRSVSLGKRLPPSGARRHG